MADTITRSLDLTHSEEECGDTALQLARRALRDLAPGGILEVRTTVAEHAFVVRAWARKSSTPVLSDTTEGRETRILLERTQDA